MMKMLLTLMTVLLLWQGASSMEEKCRECLCANSAGRTGDDNTCTMPSTPSDCLNGKYCGPYGMDEEYWIDVGRPGTSFNDCMNSWECANNTLDTYITKYCVSQFMGHGAPCTCDEQARLHHCGPYSINQDFCNSYMSTYFSPCMSR